NIKRIISCTIVIGGLIISGCTNAASSNKETAEWTLEGMFTDDIENPMCMLGIEYKASEDGFEKEGYYGYFIEGQTFYDATYEEDEGGLIGEFISYDDDYVEKGRMQARLKEEGGKGSHCPGIVHLKKFSEEAALDYEGQSMDEALTDEDAIELFGEYYDEYVAVTSDRELFEKEYAQLIADYVKYNSLGVTKYSLTDGEVRSLPLD
ncbi:MAG: hypothetical protein IJ679_01355, partial [Lachnospiraceae bacterium]|nr:hypothetical protein [Lachnospiraceae bacterium]